MKKLTFALAATVCATSAMAEITIGHVSGLVTATSNGQVINLAPGMKLPDGTQLIVPNGSSVQVSMPGCATTFGPGSVALTLAACQNYQTSAGVGGGLSPWVYGAGGVGLLAWNVNRNRNNNNNNGATVTPPVTPTTPTQPATPAVVVTPTPTPRPSNS